MVLVGKQLSPSGSQPSTFCSSSLVAFSSERIDWHNGWGSVIFGNGLSIIFAWSFYTTEMGENEVLAQGLDFTHVPDRAAKWTFFAQNSFVQRSSEPMKHTVTVLEFQSQVLVSQKVSASIDPDMHQPGQYSTGIAPRLRSPQSSCPVNYHRLRETCYVGISRIMQ